MAKQLTGWLDVDACWLLVILSCLIRSASPRAASALPAAAGTDCLGPGMESAWRIRKFIESRVLSSIIKPTVYQWARTTILLKATLQYCQTQMQMKLDRCHSCHAS